MSMIDEMVQREFNPRNVGIVEFAESDEFVGKSLYPRQRVLLKLMFLEELDGYEEDVLSEWIAGGKYNDVQISPMVRERVQILRDSGYKHFYEVDLVGGRRSSKGFITSFPAAYLMYQTMQLGDPGAHYGIDVDKEIYFSTVAGSLDQAKKYQFADIVSTATRCAAMSEHLGKVQEEGFRIHTAADRLYVDRLRAKGVKVARDWAKLRANPLAANADTIRGSATMFIAFDEMAFMEQGEENSQSAEKCYSAAKPSLQQFGRDGMIFCNSSPYTKLGRFFKQFEMAMEVDNAQPAYPTQLGFKFPSWELYRDWDKDPQRRFRKAIMVSPDWDPETLTPEEQAIQKQEQLEEKGNPETYKVERRAEWAEVVDAYFNAQAVDRAFRAVLEDHGGKRIVTNSAGDYQYAPYFAHVDPSSTTAGFGFALGHVEIFPDSRWPGGFAKHVVFDMVKRWNPEDFANHTIDYPKVSEDILQIIKWFRPAQVTFDQFNSEPIIQFLRQRLMALNLSSTRVFVEQGNNRENWQKWEVLKTAVNLDMVHIPPDGEDAEHAKKELKFLQHKMVGEYGKVDKPTIGPVKTKDIADCIRDVTYFHIGNEIQQHISTLMGTSKVTSGAQGGYPMGGRSEQGPTSFNEFYQSKRGTGSSSRARGMGGNRRR